MAVSLGYSEAVDTHLQVGAWTFLTFREDDYLFLLSSEFPCLNFSGAAFSEVRKPYSGEIMVGGYTYYWSGRSDISHAQEVAVAVFNKLTPMIIEVTPVNEREDSSLFECHFSGFCICSN